MLIDTHAHLTGKFKVDPEQVHKECKKAGVSGVVLAASNLAESTENLELAKRYPGFYFPAVGIHPQQTDPENTDPIETQVKKLEGLIDIAQKMTVKIVAVGECGLDFSEAPPEEKDRSHAEQTKLFEGQIKLAQQYALPLIIHARKAVDEVIEILTKALETGQLRGVFHCWAGGKKRIQQVVDLGFYFGIDGNVTYDQGLEEVVKQIPKDRLLLETDSPLLTPVPYRGQTNSPVNIPLIARKIAEICGLSIKEVEIITTANAKALFDI